MEGEWFISDVLRGVRMVEGGVGVREEEKGERASAGTGIGLPGSRTLQQRRRKMWIKG